MDRVIWIWSAGVEDARRQACEIYLVVELPSCRSSCDPRSSLGVPPRSQGKSRNLRLSVPSPVSFCGSQVPPCVDEYPQQLILAPDALVFAGGSCPPIGSGSALSFPETHASLYIPLGTPLPKPSSTPSQPATLSHVTASPLVALSQTQRSPPSRRLSPSPFWCCFGFSPPSNAPAPRRCTPPPRPHQKRAPSCASTSCPFSGGASPHEPSSAPPSVSRSHANSSDAESPRQYTITSPLIPRGMPRSHAYARYVCGAIG
ncbi:hypothetical protein B0H12DRAFT_617064 [Mycena haematopus]|nr:hypothetical protein B0H12DRAFT_617064 [Mycena haematopus]